mmetsp:Transcript_15155/g.26707  ORF Transcript_15155/g.26707 Transcript_15155/m.26707 type:complete len:103 (+) Transcript_15155:1174-1482(+)
MLIDCTSLSNYKLETAWLETACSKTSCDTCFGYAFACTLLLLSAWFRVCLSLDSICVNLYTPLNRQLCCVCIRVPPNPPLLIAPQPHEAWCFHHEPVGSYDS